MKPEEAIRLIRNLPTMCEFTDAYGEPIDSDNYYNAVDMAISALEKQMPKKPMKSIDSYNNNLYKLNCPTCGKYIAYGNSRVGTLHKFTMAPDMCGFCGQAIDFGE